MKDGKGALGDPFYLNVEYNRHYDFGVEIIAGVKQCFATVLN